jgi:fructosamine-3-kinase
MAEFYPIVDAISQATNTSLGTYTVSSLGGGSINSSYLLNTQQKQYFFKTNKSHLLAMFEAEAQGLSELASHNAVRIPEVICVGTTKQYSYIVLEYIDCKSMGSQTNQLLGQQLAQLHQHQQAYFGWHIDNTIGSTPQYNDRDHDWVSFLQTQRYGAQLDFIKQNGFGNLLYDKGQRLISELPKFFSNYQPHPSLLHGDLWSGNAASDADGQPIIFDPACYYGDREADIAMTELFGGFSSAFYQAYKQQYPLDAGYQTRKTLYNLYHILNHANLFGGGYASQASSMIDQLLAEI